MYVLTMFWQDTNLRYDFCPRNLFGTYSCYTKLYRIAPRSWYTRRQTFLRQVFYLSLTGGHMSEIAPSAQIDLESPRRKAGNYANYVFFVLFIVNFLNYLDRYVLTGAVTIIAKEMGFGIDGIGFLASAFLIVYTLGVIPLGAWADRAKRKDVIAVCVAVWSVATAFTAFAGNFGQLLVSRMVLGIGEAGYGPASGAIMADYFSREKRSRTLSWWATGALIGLMFGI